MPTTLIENVTQNLWSNEAFNTYTPAMKVKNLVDLPYTTQTAVQQQKQGINYQLYGMDCTCRRDSV